VDTVTEVGGRVWETGAGGGLISVGGLQKGRQVVSVYGERVCVHV
jgi:hypothetical protein